MKLSTLLVSTLFTSLSFAQECKVWVGDYKFNHKVLAPLLLEAGFTPQFIKNEDLAHSIKPNELVFQTEFTHYKSFTSPFTSINNCYVAMDLYRVTEKNFFEPILSTNGINTQEDGKMVKSQKIACTAALKRNLVKYDSCQNYLNKINKTRRLMNDPKKELEEGGSLHWESWREI